ncbi:MAG: ribonuclease HII [Ruminococcaceae bacterium]|nr:ribonuclease HII [Oscillospiraceae bacterium]
MDFEFELTLIPDNVEIVCGLDEAGRGPLAGPVYAGAVILPKGYIPEGLNDSKKLSEKKREALFDQITKNAVAWSYGIATPEEIDEINILNASMLAMKRAVEALALKPEFLLVDGNIARGFDQPALAVIKGDAKSPSIAAASIIAKVLRDRACLEMDREYPEYGFAGHKGYPTKAHFQAIEKHGVSPIHRKSFLKKRGLV